MLAYVYYEEEPGRRSAAMLLTKDEVRRIATNIAAAIAARMSDAVSIVLSSFPTLLGLFRRQDAAPTPRRSAANEV